MKRNENFWELMKEAEALWAKLSELSKNAQMRRLNITEVKHLQDVSLKGLLVIIELKEVASRYRTVRLEQGLGKSRVRSHLNSLRGGARVGDQ